MVSVKYLVIFTILVLPEAIIFGQVKINYKFGKENQIIQAQKHRTSQRWFRSVRSTHPTMRAV